MLRLFFLVLNLAFLYDAHAEIHKCVVKGRIQYQPAQCADEAQVTVLKIKESSPEQKMLEQQKLEAVRAQYESDKAMKKQIAKEQFEAAIKAADIQLKSEDVAAQHRQANAQERQADRPTVSVILPHVPTR